MPRLVRSRLASMCCALLALIVVAGILVSCGGSKSTSATQVISNIAGSWEFVAISNNGSTTGIEVALKEGQVLVNGVQQPDGQIAASNTQIAFVSLNTVSQNLNATGFGGSCQPVTTSNSLGPGSVTAANAPLVFTFTENGNVFNVNGTLGADAQSLPLGTYTAQSGNSCTDTGGSMTGKIVPKLSGSYTGQICPLGSTSACQSFSDTVNPATLTENSSGVATLTLLLSGTDNATFTMSGPVMGNAFFVQGIFQGQNLSFYGYSEQVFDSTLQTNVPSVYLVNTTNPAQPFYVGTLAVPQTP